MIIVPLLARCSVLVISWLLTWEGNVVIMVGKLPGWVAGNSPADCRPIAGTFVFVQRVAARS